jgi:predicted NAD-dependent protein-ADP-ribosyltransferase YbiA (DUF1768 family)
MYSTHPHAFNTDLWQENLLGEILMEIREDLQMQALNT